MRDLIDLNFLRIFREVVAAGSFTRASTLLAIPKSRVSRTITALERDLGVQLIYRTTRSFQLTDAGAALYRKASEPLDLLDDALSTVTSYSAEVSGALRLSAPEDVGIVLLGDIARDFMRDYPKVTIELSLDNRMVNIVQENFDLALRIGRLKDSTMTRRHVGHARMVFVMSPEMHERAGPIKSPADLASEPFVAFQSSSPQREELQFQSGQQRATLKPKRVFRTNNHFVLRSMARGGVGWALLPAFLTTEDLRQGRLIQVLKDWRHDDSPVQFVMPKQKEPALRVERFVAFATKRLAEALA